MIAAHLVIGPPVGRPQKEALVAGALRLDAKGDADKSAHILWRIASWGPGDLGLDDTIPEI
jgi:hypothetical protein